MKLTLERIQEARTLIEKAGRTPIFHYSYCISEILHGTGVDMVLKQRMPSFDPKIHKGYLIPIQYKKIIEESFKGEHSCLNIAQ